MLTMLHAQHVTTITGRERNHIAGMDPALVVLTARSKSVIPARMASMALAPLELADEMIRPSFV